MGYDNLQLLEVSRSSMGDLGLRVPLLWELPELKELVPLIELQTLQKMRNYTDFESWVAALQASYLAGSVSFEAYRAQEKLWPRFQRVPTRAALGRIYDRDTADRLARALEKWSQQLALDEEDNFRTLEQWADQIRPVESF